LGRLARSFFFLGTLVAAMETAGVGTALGGVEAAETAKAAEATTAEVAAGGGDRKIGGDGTGLRGEGKHEAQLQQPVAAAAANGGAGAGRAQGPEAPAVERPRKAERQARGESHAELESRLLKEGVLDDNFISLKEDAGEEMLPEILELYTSEGEELTKKLLELSEADGMACHLEEIQNLIHRFKGSSLNVGIAKMCASCIEVRQYCVDKDLPKARAGLVQMREEFAKAKEELEAYLEAFPKKKHKAL